MSRAGEFDPARPPGRDRKVMSDPAVPHIVAAPTLLAQGDGLFAVPSACMAARRPCKPVEHDLYFGTRIVVLKRAAHALKRENCRVQRYRYVSQHRGTAVPAIEPPQLAPGAVRHDVTQQVAYFDLQISYDVFYDVSNRNHAHNLFSVAHW